jgi:hypothetical protein
MTRIFPGGVSAPGVSDFVEMCGSCRDVRVVLAGVLNKIAMKTRMTFPEQFWTKLLRKRHRLVL